MSDLTFTPSQIFEGINALAQVCVAVAVGLGVYVAYSQLSAERRRAGREYRANKLAEAYSLLIEAIEPEGLPPEKQRPYKLKLQEAVNTIGLYSSAEIVEKASELLTAWKSTPTDARVDYTPLLSAFLTEFRKEMGYEALPKGAPIVKWYDMGDLPPPSAEQKPAPASSGKKRRGAS